MYYLVILSHVSFYSYLQDFTILRLQPYIYKPWVNTLTFMRSVTLIGWIQHSCTASFQFLHYNLVLAQQKLFITQGLNWCYSNSQNYKCETLLNLRLSTVWRPFTADTQSLSDALNPIEIHFKSYLCLYI